ncbi:7437_t:CDS:2 [Acaulospora morrowiae]|uniref:7437_t:CDS:1 n=1 Tax=Acaulospora morrowiae TaxID=94023 RepID=A0A9N9ALE9_9GLOM|nr:7437_t:CDS:2 [Acaulospora morrowiae]
MPFHDNDSTPQKSSIAPYPPIPCQIRASAFQPFSSTSPTFTSPQSLIPSHFPDRNQVPRTVFRTDELKIERQDGRSMKHGQFMFSARPRDFPTAKEMCDHQKSLYATSETISQRMDNNYGGLPGNWRYRLEVVQHPTRARACGFGNKDFRLISPAIFVKLYILADNGPVNIEQVDVHFFHLQATLHDFASKEDNTEIWVKSSCGKYERIDNLVGNKSSICHMLDDPEGKPGLWFVFSSLSVRTEKDYFLRFSLHFLGWQGSLNTGGNLMTQLATVDSNKFTVFRSKLFPGVAGGLFLIVFIDDASRVSIYLRQDSCKSRRSRVKGQEKRSIADNKGNTLELNYRDNIHTRSINCIMSAINRSKGNVASGKK